MGEWLRKSGSTRDNSALGVCFMIPASGLNPGTELDLAIRHANPNLAQEPGTRFLKFLLREKRKVSSGSGIRRARSENENIGTE